MQQRQRSMDVRRLARIAGKAIAEGYGLQVGPGRVHLALAMDCEAPYHFTLYSRGGLELVTKRRIRPLTVTGASRCRRCEKCAKRRSMHWAARSIDEYKHWPVTVFGTLTAAPHEHALLDMRARKRLAAKGEDFDLIDDEGRFRARVREFGAEVTKWLKRVRVGRSGKESYALRYLLVAEAHDSEKTSSGMRFRPHYHLMLHECVAGTVMVGSPLEAFYAGESGDYICKNGRDGKRHVFVRDEAFLRKQWKLGFSSFQFAENEKAAFYVAKYVSKSIAVRVRNSNSYGCPREAVGQGVLVNTPVQSPGRQRSEPPAREKVPELQESKTFLDSSEA